MWLNKYVEMHSLFIEKSCYICIFVCAIVCSLKLCDCYVILYVLSDMNSLSNVVLASNGENFTGAATCLFAIGGNNGCSKLH